MEFQYKISHDNLTIMGVPSKAVLDYLLNSCEGVERYWTTGNKQYHYNFTLFGGGICQIKHESEWVSTSAKIQTEKEMKLYEKPVYGQKFFPAYRKGQETVIGYVEEWVEVQPTKPHSFGKPFRLEFNPNKYKSKAGTKLILDIIRLVSDFHFSRRDIAIDLFNLDMNDFNILDFNGRKRVEYKTSSHVLETLYLGSGGSDESVRIYDKAKQQGLKGITWWRIEGQLRGDSAKEMYTNPFKKIKIVVKNGYGHLPIKERALLMYLQANPDGIKELSPNSRKKYKQLLIQDLEEISLKPDEIFKEKMQYMVEDAESWLTFSRKEEEDLVFFSALEKSVLVDDPDEEKDKDLILEQIKEWLVLAQ
jgi:hypothetical protein